MYYAAWSRTRGCQVPPLDLARVLWCITHLPHLQLGGYPGWVKLGCTTPDGPITAYANSSTPQPIRYRLIVPGEQSHPMSLPTSINPLAVKPVRCTV